MRKQSFTKILTYELRIILLNLIYIVYVHLKIVTYKIKKKIHPRTLIYCQSSRYFVLIAKILNKNMTIFKYERSNIQAGIQNE